MRFLRLLARLQHRLPSPHKVRLSNLYLYSNYSVLFVIPFAGGLRILFFGAILGLVADSPCGGGNNFNWVCTL